MSITLGEIRSNVRKIDVPYFEDTFEVKYRPSGLTPDIESKIREAASDGENSLLVDTMVDLLVDWEVLDTDGQPIPITNEVLSQMPSAFLGAILNECREDMAPKVKSGRK